jgi:arylsulfatase
VIHMPGDNGASMEGGATGTFNELTMQNGIVLTAEQQPALIDQYGGLETWGTEIMAPHYAAAWAWAGNCPFQWGKQVASHLGGAQPDGRELAARHRRQGRPAQPLQPRDRHRADDPGGRRHTGADRHTQHCFEIAGNRAMYKDGWLACWRLPRIPWDRTPER